MTKYGVQIGSTGLEFATIAWRTSFMDALSYASTVSIDGYGKEPRKYTPGSTTFALYTREEEDNLKDVGGY